MFTPEIIREGAAWFDGYAIAMSVLVAPTEFMLLDEARSPSERLVIVKGIAVASLHGVVSLVGSQGPEVVAHPTDFYLNIVNYYYQSEQAERTAEPVKLFRPNPLLSESLQNKIIKGRGLRISIPNLMAGLPVHSSFDQAVAEDVEAVRASS